MPFEVGARTANEPRMAKYVGQASVGKGPREFARALWENRSTLFSLDTAWDSARLLLYREEAKSSQSKYRKQILDDGVLKPRKWSEKEWKRRWPNSIERYSALHKNVYKGLDPTAQEYFEKTLAFMNEQGADAGHRAHAGQPQAAQDPRAAGVDRAARGGGRLRRVAAGRVRLRLPRHDRPQRSSTSTRRSGTTACT